MKLTRVHKNLNDKTTVIEYPEDYALGDTAALKETSRVHRNKIFSGRTERIQLDGVNIIFSNKTLQEDWVCDIYTDFPYLQMRFELSGNVMYAGKNREKNVYTVCSGEHTLFYSPAVNGRLVYPAGENMTTVEIEISLAWLNRVFNNNLTVLGRLAEDIKQKRTAILGGKSFPISRQLYAALMAIHQCRFPAPLKKVFIESKLMEVLTLQIMQLTSGKKQQGEHSLKEADLERIHHIKKLLLENIHKPYSINTLADIACMNRTKLQAGFKNIFGNTIYGFLAEERMKRAHQLLITGGIY